MTTKRLRRTPLLTAAVSLFVLGTASPITAQDRAGERIVPTNHVVLTGYGTVGFNYRPQGDNLNEFSTLFAPVFLYQFQDKVLFEVELEFELTEGVTETGVEYAQLDYIASDNLVLVGGKFLLPFGVFGERYHPTWINKFPTSPPLFGHHVAEFGLEPLIPILSDVGIMARGTIRPGNARISLNAYATQGPGLEDGGEEIPEIEFAASSSDNNTNKMVGGRLDVAFLPLIEFNVSFLNGDYDDQNVLDFTAWDVSAQFLYRQFQILAEYVQTRQEIETFSGFPTLRRDGFYAQASYRKREWEPVFRWTQVFDSELDGVLQEEGAWQAAFGLDYWLSPSIAVMAGYELNREDGVELDNDRFILHVAFGF